MHFWLFCILTETKLGGAFWACPSFPPLPHGPPVALPNPSYSLPLTADVLDFSNDIPTSANHYQNYLPSPLPPPFPSCLASNAAYAIDPSTLLTLSFPAFFPCNLFDLFLPSLCLSPKHLSLKDASFDPEADYLKLVLPCIEHFAHPSSNRIRIKVILDCTHFFTNGYCFPADLEFSTSTYDQNWAQSFHG